MRNFRFKFLFVLLLCGTLSVSCSTPSETTTKQKPASTTESIYPDWYNVSRAIHSDDTHYFGYATALDSDSSEAAEKAVIQAKARLKTSVSSRLEAIRNKAAGESDNSGLDTPGFILALRTAENEVPEVAETVQTEVERKDEKEAYQAYVKVSANKKTLVNELSDAFPAYKKAWETMKGSQAFDNF